MTSQVLQEKIEQTMNRGGLFMATLLQLTQIIQDEGTEAQKSEWAGLMSDYINAHQALREFGEREVPTIVPAGGSS